MIKVRYSRASGLLIMTLTGHARADVCSGAGMILQAAALGLRDLAKQWPREITFEHDSPDRNLKILDSPDRRKK